MTKYSSQFTLSKNMDHGGSDIGCSVDFCAEKCIIINSRKHKSLELCKILRFIPSNVCFDYHHLILYFS
jgi:hypothetical protein